MTMRDEKVLQMEISRIIKTRKKAMIYFLMPYFSLFISIEFVSVCQKSATIACWSVLIDQYPGTIMRRIV